MDTRLSTNLNQRDALLYINRVINKLVCVDAAIRAASVTDTKSSYGATAETMINDVRINDIHKHISSIDRNINAMYTHAKNMTLVPGIGKGQRVDEHGRVTSIVSRDFDTSVVVPVKAECNHHIFFDMKDTSKHLNHCYYCGVSIEGFRYKP